MLSSGYIVTLFVMNMDLNTYKHLLLDAIEIKDFIILLLKSIAYGFVIMLIPIYSGLKTGNAYTAISYFCTKWNGKTLYSYLFY